MFSRLVMQKDWRQLLLLVSLLIQSCFVHAEQINAVTELFYPYQIANDQDELSGYSVEVVRALTQLTGDDITIEVLPWTTALQKAKLAPSTLIFSIGRNAEREQHFHWLGVLATEKLYFWKLANARIPRSDRLMDYAQFRIAVVKDATSHQFLRNNRFLNLYVMSQAESNEDETVRIRMLTRGRADITIATAQSVRWSLERLGYAPDFLTRVYRASALDSDLYLAFSRNTPKAKVEQYQAALSQLLSSETGQQLKSKFSIE